MTDIFNENGLQVSSRPELVKDLTDGFKKIYGDDISVSSNTPDGQIIGIFGQGQADIRELLMQIYNSFDPDNCSGRLLDERCALNNVFRKGGSFTTVDITIVTDRTVSLKGLDENFNDVDASGYTIQDNAGNEFILVNSQTLEKGTHKVLFRASRIGQVETTIGTINTPVTIVLGVVSVNNPSAPVNMGVNEETDAQLKIRRRQSVSIGSAGYLNGLLASVLQLDGVTDVALYENYTNTEDKLGIPPHCIWLIVEGGSSKDIANTLYLKKSYGCDMRGEITSTIITDSQQQFIAKWDEPKTVNFYVKFQLKPLKEGVVFDQEAIKNYILDNTSFKIGSYVETSSLTAICQKAIDENGGEGLALKVEVSTDQLSWVEFIEPEAASKPVLTSIDIEVLGGA